VRYDVHALKPMQRPGLIRVVIGLVTALACVEVSVTAQAPTTRSALPLTVLSAEGRRGLAVVLAGDQEMIALEDLAPIFDLTIREDTVARGVAVSHKGKTIVLTAGQGLASVAGRLVSLPAPVVRDGRHWLVPLEFISRALGPVYEAKVDLRRSSRLVVIGDLRVPRIVARQELLGSESRVTFEITPKTGHAIVPQQGRLLVRFESDFLDVTVPTTGGQGPVQAIRVVDPATTIALELGPSYASFRASVVPADSPQGPMRLVIDVMTTAAPPPQLPQAVPRQEAPPPLASATPPGIRTIVIDPGHGGDETGARGPAGNVEKDVTLSVARRLKSTIESRLGLRVLMTRDGDETVSLDDRAVLANSNRADLFISLHANAAPRKNPRGAEVFYLSTERATSEARGSVQQELPALGGGSREIEVILWEMAQTRHLAQSAAFAELIEGELSNRLKMSARPVQQAPFRVLVGANMPAVLVEMGFLSNPGEEKQLVSAEYQNVVVQAIFDALVRFRGQVERGEQVRQSPSAAVRRPPSCP
jgi:N-acetylmuramoyl-L-alanine amidase